MASLADRLARVMHHQYKNAIDEDHPFLIPYMNLKNIKEWYFLVCNLPPPYVGGEFIFKLTASDQANKMFPRYPPSFEFITPNGVYKPGGAICISIGEFHAQQQNAKDGATGWRPSLGMRGFAREVVNGMIVPDNLGSGIRIMKTEAAEKRAYAADSARYNAAHNSKLMDAFAEFERDHPDHTAVRLRRQGRAIERLRGVGTIRPDGETLQVALGDLWEYLGELLTRHGNITRKDELYQPLWYICEAALNGETAVRKAMGRALHTRLLLMEEPGGAEPGTEPGADPDALSAAVGRWSLDPPGVQAEALDRFFEALPDACGGASRETVPAALAPLRESPKAFPLIFHQLFEFLAETDIDEKKRLGRELADCAAVAMG